MNKKKWIIYRFLLMEFRVNNNNCWSLDFFDVPNNVIGKRNKKTHTLGFFLVADFDAQKR